MSPDANLNWFRELQQEAYTNPSPMNNCSGMYNVLNAQLHQPGIKVEPGDTSPYGAQFGNYRNLPNSPSPQYKASTPSPPLPLHTDPNYHHLWNYGAGPSNVPPPNLLPSSVMQSNVPHSNVPLSNVAQSSCSGVAQSEQHSTNSASNLFNMDRQQFDQMPTMSTDELRQLLYLESRPDDVLLDQVENSFMHLSTEQDTSNIHVYNNFDGLN